TPGPSSPDRVVLEAVKAIGLFLPEGRSPDRSNRADVTAVCDRDRGARGAGEQAANPGGLHPGKPAGRHPFHPVAACATMTPMSSLTEQRADRAATVLLL